MTSEIIQTNIFDIVQKLILNSFSIYVQNCQINVKKKLITWVKNFSYPTSSWLIENRKINSPEISKTKSISKSSSISPNKEIPYPPIEMRKLVGPTDEYYFDNQDECFIFSDCPIPPEAYKSILDFGCGCGRNARRLMKQKTRPEQYVGIDLHSGMINWCQNNLTPIDNNFSFYHYDVYSKLLNPNSDKNFELFPVTDSSCSLVIAHSVFTHIIEDLVISYLKECLRVMSPESYFVSTWFLFDKKYFPMMQESQNSLYINTIDPTNAVIYDHKWLFKVCHEIGLIPVHIIKPMIKGFHLFMEH